MYLVVEMENESRQSSSQQHANDISTCREPNQYFITAKLRNREIVIFTHCIDSESSPSSLSLFLCLCPCLVAVGVIHNFQLCSLHSHVDYEEEGDERRDCGAKIISCKEQRIGCDCDSR